MPQVELDQLRARVAKRIREQAERKGISLTQLASGAGVSKAHLWTVLSGKSAASIDFLGKLALVLQIDPDELVRRDRKPRG